MDEHLTADECDELADALSLDAAAVPSEERLSWRPYSLLSISLAWISYSDASLRSSAFV